jgi:hypothetical protein
MREIPVLSSSPNGVTVMSVTLPELKESLNGSQNESTQLKIARWWFSTAAAFYK